MRINADYFSLRNLRKSALIVVSLFVFASVATAQKVAVLVPEKNEQSLNFAANLENSLSAKFQILNSDLSETAFRSVETEDVFNLTTSEAKNIGAVVGSDYFLLVKTANQRRAALSRNDYYESYAFIYAVSSRTGRLVFWKLQTFEAENQTDAEKILLASTNQLANEIAAKLNSVQKEEANEKAAPKIEQVPAEDSPDAKNFRPPLPFKRIKPEYTRTAYLYSVAATVEIELDLDESGTITRTKIVRWAGFGLDEAVTDAVRAMNWRAAERKGKKLAMRVLLRYNFKKVDR